MPHIVKSSLDIGGKIIPWNEREIDKLIKEKKEFLKENKVEEKKEILKEEKRLEIKKEKPETKKKAGEK